MTERPMNGAERRKVNQVLRQALALEVLRQGDWKARELDREFAPTDRVCQRWAISVGDGKKLDKWEETPVSRLSPLDDATAIIVDQTIMHSPVRVRRLVFPWYKGTGGTVSLRIKLGLDTNGVLLEWRAAMMYLEHQFRATEHRDLVEMLDVRL